MNNEIVQIEMHPAPGLDSIAQLIECRTCNLEQFPAVGGPGSGPGGNQLFNLYMSFNLIYNTLFHKNSRILLNPRMAADERAWPTDERNARVEREMRICQSLLIITKTIFYFYIFVRKVRSMIRNPFLFYIVTSNIFMFYCQHYPSYPAGDSGRMGHFSGGDGVRKGLF